MSKQATAFAHQTPAEASYNRGHQCPACQSIRTEVVLSLPPVPIHVGLLWPTKAEAVACPRGGMRLALCDQCGYVWNVEFSLADTQYEKDYDNSLHHSPMFADWERRLVSGLIDRHSLRGRRIAEIGSGDGRFLAQLCVLGENAGIGFEPGFNAERASELVAQANLHIYPHMADAESLRGSEVDFVIARHLLEHLPEPRVLIDAIRVGTADGGSVYIEVPNLDLTLERHAFEDFMYEHCGYYTPQTLGHLFRSSGFERVTSEPTFDSLFVGMEAMVSSGSAEPGPIERSVVDEVRRGLRVLGQRMESIDGQLSQLRDEGKRIVAWGGGARAVGLLNLVPSSDGVEYVVDVNPRKQGTFVTGSGHPILDPGELKKRPPDVVYIVNPVYRDEIVGMLSELDVRAEVLSL